MSFFSLQLAASFDKCAAMHVDYNSKIWVIGVSFGNLLALPAADTVLCSSRLH